jgi:hypothetical protein
MSNHFFKKKLGYVLVEVMFAMALLSVMFLMIYGAYSTIFKSIRFLKNTNDLHKSRMISMYHINNDLICMYLPFEFQYIKELSTKLSKNDSSSAKTQIKEESEKDKKKTEEEFKYYMKFFPTLKIEKNEEIILTFYSTRLLLNDKNKKKFGKIIYKFTPLKNTINQKEKLFSLSRAEIPIDENENNYKNYNLIDLVEVPEIIFLVPIKPKKENEKNADSIQEMENFNQAEASNKKNNGKENCFEKFHEKMQYEELKKTEEINAEDFLKKTNTPCLIKIHGILHSADRTKKLPFSFLFSIPNSELLFYSMCNPDENKIEHEQEKTNFKKKDNNLQQNETSQQEEINAED